MKIFTSRRGKVILGDIRVCLALFLCMVGSIQSEAQEVLHEYKIQNLLSDVVMEKFQQINQSISVYDHREGNRLILKGEQAAIDLALEELALLDVQQKMVEIEFMLVEYFHGTDFDWSLDLTEGQFGSFSDIRLTTGALKGLEFLFNGVSRLSPKFKLNLSALSSENKASIITNPHLVAQSGSKANFEVKEEIQIKLAEVNNNSGLIIQRLESVSAGILLNINAVPTHNGIIHLDVQGTVSQFLPFSTEGEFRKQETFITTSVDLKDGETLIIGGIINEKDNEIDAGIPILKKIPLLGYLFKRRKEVREYTERVIYLTPRVFTADDVTKEQSLERYKEIRKANELEDEVSEVIELDPELMNFESTKNDFNKSRANRARRKAKKEAKKAAKRAQELQDQEEG